MKIKNPTLLSKKINEMYLVSVEGTNVIATYTYNMDNEQSGGWEYDLSPCYVGLSEDEIEDLEEEFYGVLCETQRNGGNK